MDKDGLFISGTVNGRAKRLVGENKTELVTYKILAGGRDFFVKDWSPNDVYYNIGDKVSIPVSIKIYNRNGQSSLDYSVAKPGLMLGETF